MEFSGMEQSFLLSHFSLTCLGLHGAVLQVYTNSSRRRTVLTFFVSLFILSRKTVATAAAGAATAAAEAPTAAATATAAAAAAAVCQDKLEAMPKLQHPLSCTHPQLKYRSLARKMCVDTQLRTCPNACLVFWGGI